MLTVRFRSYRATTETLEVEVGWVKQKRDVVMRRRELHGFTRPGTEKKRKTKHVPRVHQDCTGPEPLHRKRQQLKPHFLLTHQTPGVAHSSFQSLSVPRVENPSFTRIHQRLSSCCVLHCKCCFLHHQLPAVLTLTHSTAPSLAAPATPALFFVQS